MYPLFSSWSLLQPWQTTRLPSPLTVMIYILYSCLPGKAPAWYRCCRHKFCQLVESLRNPWVQVHWQLANFCWIITNGLKWCWRKIRAETGSFFACHCIALSEYQIRCVLKVQKCKMHISTMLVKPLRTKK